MIQRELMRALERWKGSPSRQPLLLYGARQVGKTWLLRHFGSEHFDDVAYFNFDANQALSALFVPDLNIERIVNALSVLRGAPIVPGKTFLIFDEVQECPRALTSLKYFKENAPQYHVAAAGSLLGLTDHQGTGFPVGCVDIMHLRPCTFREFLTACQEQSTVGAADSAQQYVDLLAVLTLADTSPEVAAPLINAVHANLVAALKEYMVIGGMPAVINEFVATRNVNDARRVQQSILDSYDADISKHVPARDMEFVRAIWRMIPAFLARENKKMIFGQVVEGKRAKDFLGGLNWLEQAGVIYRICRISKPALPLRAYEQHNAFKAFVLDVGLLGAMSGIAPETLLVGNAAFTEFKGALTEQYVCQELVALLGEPPHYWSSPKSTSEIDFLVQDRGSIWAIEVKASENLRAKSLRVFCADHPHVTALRTSMSPFRVQDWMRNIPLYAVAIRSLWSDSSPHSPATGGI